MTKFATNIKHLRDMKEINYKEMKFNPFNLIGGEWMLVTAGDEASCNPYDVCRQDWEGAGKGWWVFEVEHVQFNI